MTWHLAELTQAVTSAIGLGLGVAIFALRAGDLRDVYRSGKNGIKEVQAIGHLAVSACIAALQALWLTTAFASLWVHTVSEEAQRVEHAMALRGAIGSSVLMMATLIQHYARRRIQELDGQEHRGITATITQAIRDSAADAADSTCRVAVVAETTAAKLQKTTEMAAAEVAAIAEKAAADVAAVAEEKFQALSARIDAGTQHAERAYHEANSVNQKIAELQQQLLKQGKQKADK